MWQGDGKTGQQIRSSMAVSGTVCERACVPGGILAGLISDYTNGRATTCCIMLILAAPMVRV